MGSLDPCAEAARRRLDVVQWLNGLLPELRIPLAVSDEELRVWLLDGEVFTGILSKLYPSFAVARMKLGDFVLSDKRSVHIRQFILALEELGLPSFKLSDLERGPISHIVVCLMSLKDRLDLNSGARNAKLITGNEGRDKAKDLMDPKFWKAPFSPPASGYPATAFSHHHGQKFQEVFELKRGVYSDVSPAKIPEMMKFNSLDIQNAPTKSLLGVVNGILDESIQRKNGEVPHRVACLLRTVVQEIERRVSTQAEHIKTQNNLIKARDEKYQSRIKVLETLANGMNEETQIIMNHLQKVKSVKSSIEETKSLDEEDLSKIISEKESSEQTILELKQDLEKTKQMYEHRHQELESSSLETKLLLEERLKGMESLLGASRNRLNELETSSESKFQHWKQKEQTFCDFIQFQLGTIQKLRMASAHLKQEITAYERQWCGDLCDFGLKLKILVVASEKYHVILEENRKLFNELQELKGNIRVFCRIRPFLPGQNNKLTTVDYIGENGELLIRNLSKTGKDAHRMFKFNKVFGPSATQEEVFLDTQPLIRSVLDGYNVCIFAYGQTGSGKTYTMNGPNNSSEADSGVNYRALTDLFHISQNRSSTIMYEVGVQMVEIYNEQVRDLLANDCSQKRLGIWSTPQPNGLAVPDATLHSVKSTRDVLNLMKVGHANRAMGATALNERSSRSHSILTVHVHGLDTKVGATLQGSLHLVDLAGSERVDRSEVTGDRMKETQYINKSLSALGDVIFALSQKNAHIPYRNSKLTQVLQSSLGGHAKTLMLVQINPDVDSYSETLSTLKFAERVSGVELGAARSSNGGKDVRELMEQVASLKDIIAKKDEEIEKFELLKGVETLLPRAFERGGGDSLKHMTSSSSIQLLTNLRYTSGAMSTSSIISPNSDHSFSDYSDMHSDIVSHKSVDDFRTKENLGQSFPVDVELLGLGDGDSEERLSDISDSVLSKGTEMDGSIGSNSVEFTLFPESKLEQKSIVQPQILKSNLTKAAQTSFTRHKSGNIPKPTSSRKSTTASWTKAKPSKPWQ